MSFEHNSIRKNLFLSACFCWDSRLSLREMDQKYNFGGPIGYGNWYLEFLFRHFKIFRLHAILHDGAGAVRSHSGEGPGYCYEDLVIVSWLLSPNYCYKDCYEVTVVIERGPNSCLLGHVTGLLFCFYEKIFLRSVFNSVDFWNSMSLIVLDIELTEEDINKQLGLYIDGSLQGFSFSPPTTCKPNKQTTRNTRHLHGISWSTRKLDYDTLFAGFYDIKVMNAEVFAKWLEKCRLSIRFLGQNVENLDDYGCPKIPDLVGDGKTDRSCICSSYLFRNKTRPHCAERKAKVYGEWATQHFYVFVRVYCICVHY